MSLLQQMESDKRETREALRRQTRELLLLHLKRLLPKDSRVIVFGSLTMPFRFGDYSDIDIALPGEVDPRAVDRLVIDLREAMHRPVDVLALDGCRFREKILQKGEAWTLSD